MAHFRSIHAWDIGRAEAAVLQEQLAYRVELRPLAGEVGTVAGLALSRERGTERVFAAAVVLELPDLEPVEEVGVLAEARFPELAELLSFREAPPLLEAWARLECEPDAVLVDGAGIAHPRRLGLASHLGMLLELPTFGCVLDGPFGAFREPGPHRGDWTPLVGGRELLGAAVRTRERAPPIFISPGHEIDLSGALELALQCSTGDRIPEPLRRARELVSAMQSGERAAIRAVEPVVATRDLP